MPPPSSYLPASPPPVAISPQRIPPQTRPGYVMLNVIDLDNEITFYTELLGLELNWREEQAAGLGVKGNDLLRMTAVPSAPRPQGVTGLYHFAILYPDQKELARAIARLMTHDWPNSPTDHVMTKTTYLDDPEGNTIELYAESPEDGIFLFEDGDFTARRADGSPSNGRETLDMVRLFAHLSPSDALDLPITPLARLGHIHLFVNNLEQTRHFYHALLGFDDMGVSALFGMGMVSAAGYHHHIGYNTWQGQGAPPRPVGSPGLNHYSLYLPSDDALENLVTRLRDLKLQLAQSEPGYQISDPSDNRLLMTTAERAEQYR